jgi:hypothetical protein
MSLEMALIVMAATIVAPVAMVLMVMREMNKG